jgi:hypothetical protein
MVRGFDGGSDGGFEGAVGCAAELEDFVEVAFDF